MMLGSPSGSRIGSRVKYLVNTCLPQHFCSKMEASATQPEITMKLSINTQIYNEKRYSKPYIGLVNPADGKVTAWGNWIGTPGNKGILEIEAKAGDVIIEGRKDNRVNNGTPNYGLVKTDGSIEYMGKADAVKAARAMADAEASRPMEDRLADQLASILDALGVASTEEALARIAAMQAA